MTEPQVRAFIAIDLPETIKASLATAIRELQATLPGSEYAWVRAESIHLTLKFLGHVDSDRVPTIVKALAAAASDISPFDLRLAGTGTFPSGRRPNIVWAGLDGDLDALSTLRTHAVSAMTALGFAPERLTFRPHLTLARIRSRMSDGNVQALHDALAALALDADEPFTVNELRLVRSELLPEGARYSTLGTVDLVG
ncbi:MAG: RNA 2',3'-cyclic phosphodiesterase [Chloroflexi bacterium]|nr:RNA 2',3'-cyclic phosphodiesterase [Chloroflexota bacterium]